MAGRGLATVAIVAVLLVVIGGAAVFGYMFLLPANKSSSTTTQSSTPTSATAQTAASPSSGTVVISNAAISNGSLLLTVQNKGSEAVSLDTLLITPGAGCNFASIFSRTSVSSSASSSLAAQNQSRIPFTIPPCIEAAVPFVVHSNSTLAPIARGQFNASRLFNFSSFNATRSFSRSANFSRSFSGNFTRPPPGSNFSGFPGGAFGFFGNLSAGAGLEVAPGQSVTLAYSGPIGSGVTAGSQYTIIVEGQLAEAQITVSAT